MNDTIFSIFLWFVAILVLGSPVWAWVILKILHKPAVKKIFVGTSNIECRSYARVVLAIVFVPCVLWLIITTIRSNITSLFPESPWAYAMEYNTESKYVVIDPKPHDCEFLKAPIGSKYCHFDRVVGTQKGDEVLHQKTRVFVGWNKVPE